MRNASSTCKNQLHPRRRTKQVKQLIIFVSRVNQSLCAARSLSCRSSKIKMASPKLVVMGFLYIFLAFLMIPAEVSSFWLTDSSLFQAPIQVLLPQQQAVKTEYSNNNNSNNQNRRAETATANSDAAAVQVKGEPWIKLDQPEQSQQQQCQCSADWIQNQTSVWLNKWLTSSSVANQMRLLVSNSTGASSDINRRRATNETHYSLTALPASTTAVAGGNNNTSANNSGSNHWNAWTRSSRGNSEPARPLPRGSRSGHNSNHHNHQQQQLKLAQGPRGPPGPKGETGARGETGSSGLTRVSNRDALFDLNTHRAFANEQPASSNSSSSGKQQDTSGATQQQQQPRGLVFIESEQMLVVGTETGWRPVQLLPALRDFRKAIAKFSLTSPEERRRLLAQFPVDNSIRLSSVGLAAESSSLRNRATAASSFYSSESLDDSLDSEDDDQDDDEDGDGGDEEEEDGGDEDGADDEGPDYGNRIRGRANDERVGSDNNFQRASSLVVAKSKGPSARSAAAALVSASIENSVTMGSPMETGPRKQQPIAREVAGERQMRLRLAALNEPFAGNIHGIRGADFECKRNAAKANVKGSFRAFLASGFQNLNEVVRYNVHKYPVVNLRGEVLASSWHDLFKRPTRVPNPLTRVYSFDGRHVATDSNWPNKLIWHGATNKVGYRDLMHNCDGWHSDSLSKFGFASPLHPIKNNLTATKRRQRKRHLSDSKSPSEAQNHLLEAIDKYPCRMPLIVLCIETIGQHSEPTKVVDDVDSSNMVSS